MRFVKRWFAPKTSPKKTAEPSELAVTAATHILTQELIALQKQAQKLNTRQRSFARSTSAGSHHSRFRGRGMDYQESRIYQAGDDIRNMDWRVTARAGKPHTKLYQEERERPVVFVVDLNPSMFFGSTNTFKSVLAAKVATLIAWSVAWQGDRIGTLILSAQQHHERPPKTGKRGVLQLIRELVAYGDPVNALTNTYADKSLHLNDELKRLRRLAKPGSMVYLISDFYTVNEETAAQLQLISKHSDIQAIQILDPLELAPPPPESYAVTDGKSTGVINTQSQQGQQNYQQFFQQHHERVSNLMRQQRIPLLKLSTADDVLLRLQQHFGNSKKSTIVAGATREVA